MNNKTALTQAMKATGLQSQIKTIFVIHPILEQIALKLAEYIDMIAIDEDGKPLLVTALKMASKEYLDKVDNGMPEEQAMADFIRSLLTSGTKVFNQEIVIETETGAILWQPFASSITKFLEGRNAVETKASFKVAPIKKSIATAFVSMWLIPPELLNTPIWADLLNEMEE